ncbi:MAG TPA: SDR family NAD(P)-dependent oxidoreductase [Ilumatobacteraceae bacterium]|nr:SDR family NAD(P)-dependent oxidoreductase [Ilumatobacteraceae bacterium]
MSERVWLVTGSSRGLGRALVEALADAGQHVVATARDITSLNDLVVRFPDRVMATALDVADRAQATAAVAATIERFGRIDVVVNNAGYMLRGAVEELTENELAEQFNTNLFGALHVSRAALPAMRANRSGHIMLISSAGATYVTAGMGAYSASKAALEAFGEALAAEVKPFGIRTTVVIPGPFRTDFNGTSTRNRSDPIADYAAQIDAEIEAAGQRHGTQSGDPAKAAAALIALADVHDPPLRVPLGRMAFVVTRLGLRQRLDGLDLAEQLGYDCDFPR